MSKLIECTMCNKMISPNASLCPNCSEPQNDTESQVNEQTDNNLEKGRKSKKVIALICILALLAIGFIYINNSVLNGDDLIVYNMIAEISHKFKSPQSVQIISGSISEEETLFARISATNGFGASGSTDYIIFYLKGDLILLEDTTSPKSYFETDGLNIKKINKKLKNRFK